MGHTIICRINTPGAEAENEPLPLSDFVETHSVEYRSSCGENMYQISSVLCEIYPVKVKSRRGGHVHSGRYVYSVTWIFRKARAAHNISSVV